MVRALNDRGFRLPNNLYGDCGFYLNSKPCNICGMSYGGLILKGKLPRYKEISVSTFWKRLASDDDLPEELPPIKTKDALKAMEGCNDVKRVFKTLYPDIF
jgi:hypothetical protein